MTSYASSLIAAAAVAALAANQPASTLRTEIDALNRSMVEAFKRDPATVAAYYSDTSAIIGGGQRTQGRAAIDTYWRQGAMFTSWSLETLETGGHPDAPWQYGRSVAQGRSGRTMETFFVGVLRRQSGGELKF